MSGEDFLWSMILMGAMVVVIIAAVAFTRHRAHLRRARRGDGSDYDRAAYE